MYDCSMHIFHLSDKFPVQKIIMLKAIPFTINVFNILDSTTSLHKTSSDCGYIENIFIGNLKQEQDLEK